MEHDEAKDMTLALLRALGEEFRRRPTLGCVIQAYRKDAFGDLRDDRRVVGADAVRAARRSAW